MTEQKKQEEPKIRLKNDLKRKVRKNRPAEKVLEIAVMMFEDQMEILDRQRENFEWKANYLRTLDPAEIEPDK